MVDPPNGAEIVTPTEAEVIDPGNTVVDLGPLDTSERVILEAEVDPVPSGAPQAGYGGASASDGPNTDWAAAGGVFLFLAGMGSLVVWRYRRRT